ncbi:MAG: TerC family protein, partial [Burkholderiales bacterium]
PSIVYVGGAVLAWTAAKMISSEPFVAAALQERPAWSTLIYFAVIGGVLASAWMRNRASSQARQLPSP